MGRDGENLDDTDGGVEHWSSWTHAHQREELQRHKASLRKRTWQYDCGGSPSAGRSGA